MICTIALVVFAMCQVCVYIVRYLLVYVQVQLILVLQLLRTFCFIYMYTYVHAYVVHAQSCVERSHDGLNALWMGAGGVSLSKQCMNRSIGVWHYSCVLN